MGCSCCQDVSNHYSPDCDSDDDVWEEEDKQFVPTGDIQRTHHKQGYLDGLSKAQQTSLQTGFDDGYPTGANFGVRVGVVLSQLSDKPELLEQAKKELQVTKVLQKSYFDENLELVKADHEILQKWEEIASQHKK